MADLEDVVAGAFKRTSDTVTFLPEPTPRQQKYTIVSVDDHLVEPPDMFEGRLAKCFVEDGPRIVEDELGRQAWHFDGQTYSNVGFNAVTGRPIDEYSMDPTRFDEMRRGAWDIDARIHDMDINGVAASLNFPSLLSGFAGVKFSNTNDLDLGLAVMRAWNDWHIESWAGPYPHRIIPCQVTWLNDPNIAAEEIRRNAERGFRAVTFPELPDKLGRPSMHSGYWLPFLRACEETETVICLHVGSSGTTQMSSDDAPTEVVPALFTLNAIVAAVDWIFAKVPVQCPNLKIAMSEGGIGWVPMLIDRLDHNLRHHRHASWGDIPETPSEVLKRNFWFCAIDEPAGFEMRHRIGVENLMFESDYPHADSTWPDTQEVVGRQLVGMTDAEIRMVTHENACRLFQHELA